MCGIYSYIGKENINLKKYNEIRSRGPDNTTVKQISTNAYFCFHRLMINDLSETGNQPMQYENITLMCNGEIYNSDQLKKEFDVEYKSNSDCEVLIHMYNKYGFKDMLDRIDGVFAILLHDSASNKMWLGRDPFGVRPMFFGNDENNIEIASELKSIENSYKSSQFPPGHFMSIQLPSMKCSEPERYHYIDRDIIFKGMSYDYYAEQVKINFEDAVKKRLMSDRPIGCLLSGGLDSSLVCGIVAREYKEQNKGILNTFSIGFSESTDLKYAKKVAEHIGSNHHEILLQESDFINAIPEVIKTIESYDTTTVRASVGNYLVSKYIKENTNITVVYNGDGSDEVAGGYLYLKRAPSYTDFENECERLLNEIYFFDVLRSDRCVSSKWSLEARTPFLDKKFVNTYLSVPVQYRVQEAYGAEKSLLRNAFKNDNIIPNDVLFRTKEAFSDGVSGSQNSWHKVIQAFIDTQVSDEEFIENKERIRFNTPILKESYYYRKIFESYYPNKGFIIPHFWMPKWTSTNDPSARELD